MPRARLLSLLCVYSTGASAAALLASAAPTINDDALAAIVSKAKSDSNILSGMMSQRTMRAKALPPFECLSSDSGDSIARLIAEHDDFVFDMDGVLWSGSLGLLPGAVDAIDMLRAAGKRCIFVTNNSARSRAAYLEKLTALGLQSSAEEIVPSSFAAARWLARERPDVKAAFVIGEAGVAEELMAAGIEVVRHTSDENAGAFDEAAFATCEPDPRIGAVVVGADPSFSFGALAMASLCLQRNEGCTFVATNDDAYDVVNGRKLPGNGALVAALETACGRPPDAICGKPSSDLAEYLVSSYGLDPSRTLVIGDRMDTDIALANAMGADSLLVLTGAATTSELLKLAPGFATSLNKVRPPTCPTAVASHLGALLPS